MKQTTRASNNRLLALLPPAVAAVIGLSVSFTACLAATQPSPAPTGRWWKGNLHTHTLWSDGTDFPEAVVEWYKTNGYHFLALSDHNALQHGQKWLTIGNKRLETLTRQYAERFGPRRVEQQFGEDYHKVRLKTLAEFRPLFEEPGRFLLIQSEEITDRLREEEGSTPVHVNATNLRYFIRPAGGYTVLDVLQRNIDSVLAQRRSTGQPMIPHIAHPNFGWALTAEDLMHVRGEQFFEVYNGHPSVHNAGNAERPNTDRLWDIALTFRLTELGLGPLFALAVDDAHQYHAYSRSNANPGRGWVMVRAPRLAPVPLIEAMEAGDFYASTGVTLREVRRDPRELSLVIEPEPEVTYTTQFIGTRRGFDPESQPAPEPVDDMPAFSRRYSADIGMVLAEVKGTTASYTLQGDEIYVRAKVISSKRKANGTLPNEREMAWVQPLIPAPRR